MKEYKVATTTKSELLSIIIRQGEKICDLLLKEKELIKFILDKEEKFYDLDVGGHKMILSNKDNVDINILIQILLKIRSEIEEAKKYKEQFEKQLR